MKRFSKVTLISTSVVLAGLVCFDVFVNWCVQNSTSVGWELFALVGIVLFIGIMLVMASMWLHYLEIRYFR